MTINSVDADNLRTVASKMNNKLSQECLDLLSYLLLKAEKNDSGILELPDDVVETPIHISNKATELTFYIIAGKEPIDIKPTKVFKYCFFSM